MNTIRYLALQEAQIGELLTLQRQNLKIYKSVEDCDASGFLTFTYDEALLRKMMAHMPQPIAMVDDRIVGYALAVSKPVCANDEQLSPIIDICATLQIDGLPVEDHPYYVLGQICVAEEMRGLGIFEGLYQMHKQWFSKHYTRIITEIASKNSRSLYKHQGLGFREIHQYQQDDTLWKVVYWDF